MQKLTAVRRAAFVAGALACVLAGIVQLAAGAGQDASPVG